ncbi:MAG: hypothetical protein C4534_00220 [Gaiellales bacterium]|nr:MAG: hypothetical protein C4534_00220 [Gaiellales bacterium]
MGHLSRILSVGVLSGALIVVSGCGEESAEQVLEAPSSKVRDVVASGVLEGGTYINPALGLQMRIPDGWKVLDGDILNDAAELGGEIAGDEEELEVDIGQTMLLATSKFPMDETVEFNPNLNISVMDGIAEDPRLNSGIELARLEKEYVDEGGMPGYVVGEIHAEDIGGRSFGVLVFDKTAFASHQKKYVTVIDGFVLLAVLTYSTDNELAELDAIVATMSFD